MSRGRIILEQDRFRLTIERLCHQLIEEYQDFSNCCIIGVQPRGINLSDRVHERLNAILKKTKHQYGKIDITFYRDDFRTREKPLVASSTEMDFIIENKRVILIDDVLYTGRTIQAALIALNHYGRPKSVELLTLIDRRFNRELPIESDYTGITIDAYDETYVKVEWEEHDGADRIKIFPRKK